MVILGIGLSATAGAQQVFELLEYQPAPGQLINTPWGKPGTAFHFAEGLGGSLGAFGGYADFRCMPAVENHPDNPYGVDFTLFGNPMNTWSEPGAVWVMKDANKNGAADDTWYLLAGADYYFSSTSNDSVSWYRNSDTEDEPVSWKDQAGNSGQLLRNDFHLQAWYPSPEYFPEIPADSVKVGGLRLKSLLDESSGGLTKYPERAFGFADNSPVVDVNHGLPDNPYTDETEGSGGDAMDIAWAVDADGNPVVLDQIDFIRVQTAVLALSAALGEISTEITQIRDVAPDHTVSGSRHMLVMEDLPPMLGLGQELELKAHFFENGKPLSNQQYQWSVSPAGLAEIQENSRLIALGEGTVEVQVALAEVPAMVVRKNMVISASVQPGDTTPQAFPEGDQKEVFLSYATETETLLPGHTLRVGQNRLSDWFVEPSQWEEEQSAQLSGLHALTAPFENVTFESDLRFAVDRGVYLYQVPWYDQNYVRYYYGFGSASPQQGAWLIRKNNSFSLDSLENLSLESGDRFWAMHISDFSQPLTLPFLHVDKDTVSAGEEFLLRLEEVELKVEENGEVQVLASRPVEAEPVFADPVPGKGGNSVEGLSGEDGSLLMQMDTQGEYLISWRHLQTVLVVKDGMISSNRQLYNIPLRLYPNPASDQVYLQTDAEILSVEAVSLCGQIYLPGLQGKKLDVSHMPAGMYMLRLYSKQAVLNRKLLVQ